MISISINGLIVYVPKEVVLGYLNFLNVQPYLKKVMTLEQYDLTRKNAIKQESDDEGYSGFSENISNSYVDARICFETFQPINLPLEVYRRFKKERKAGESLEYFLINIYETTDFTVETTDFTDESPEFTDEEYDVNIDYEAINNEDNYYDDINNQVDSYIEEEPFVEYYNNSVNVRVEKKPLAEMDDAEIDALFAKPPWMRYK